MGKIGFEKKGQGARLLQNISPNTRRLGIILVGVLAMISVFKASSFWTTNNFQSMLFQLPEFGLLSFCLMLAYASGGVDLSVVGTANTASVLMAMILMRFAPETASLPQQIAVILIALLAALVVGALLGLVNGLLITKVGIPAMLATLGTEQLYFGLAKVLTKAETLSNIQPTFTAFANTTIAKVITIPFICFVLVAIFMGWLMSKNQFGFKHAMVGYNTNAAEYSGINAENTIITTYVISGVLAALAGVIMMARTNSAKAGYGTTYLTQAILTAILGGTSASGGSCTVSGVVLAIVVVQALSSTLNMFTNISNFYLGLIWGVVLLIAIAFNYYDDVKKKRS